jgi:PPOX class probable F420-dependent enzyme
MPLSEKEIHRFLNGRRNAILGVNRRNGPPQLTPVWFLWNGKEFYISTTRERHKFRFLERDPRVTLCIDDPVTLRSVTAEGTVEIRDADIWPISEAIVDRYLDKPFADRMMKKAHMESRVLLVIRPDKWLSWDLSERVLSLDGE